MKETLKEKEYLIKEEKKDNDYEPLLKSTRNKYL